MIPPPRRLKRKIDVERSIKSLLNRTRKRVFAWSELVKLIQTCGEDLPEFAHKIVTPEMLITKLGLPLRECILRSDDYAQTFPRYLWRNPHPLEVAASVRAPNSYLCHSSALFIHGLIERLPTDLHVNYEQSPKPKPSGQLSQTSIDRAFRVAQRQSTFIFRYAERRIVVLSGKCTRGFGVGNQVLPGGATVRVTNLERTLIDSTVRPAYAGGIIQVLDAFRSACRRTSAEKLIAVLREMDYTYPYHQAIGFYMERAGFSVRQLSQIRELGIGFDFYLAHGMKATAYDPRWRVHFPRNL